jgi:hypothetical protein
MANASSLNLSELYYYLVFNVHVFEALITEAAVHDYKIYQTVLMIDFELAARKAIEIIFYKCTVKG